MQNWFDSIFSNIVFVNFASYGVYELPDIGFGLQLDLLGYETIDRNSETSNEQHWYRGCYGFKAIIYFIIGLLNCAYLLLFQQWVCSKECDEKQSLKSVEEVEEKQFENQVVFTGRKELMVFKVVAFESNSCVESIEDCNLDWQHYTHYGFSID